MGITLPNVKPEVQDTYVMNAEHKSSWINQFDQYVDHFDFHPMLKMPGSELEVAGFFDNNDYYATPSGACSPLVKTNVYVDGKGIVQPCCWAVDVSNLGDLNTQTFSQTFIDRLKFKSALDFDRSNNDICINCSQDCQARL